MEKESFDGKTDLQKGGKGVSLQIESLDADIGGRRIQSIKNRETRQVMKCMAIVVSWLMFCDLLVDVRTYIYNIDSSTHFVELSQFVYDSSMYLVST